MLQKQKQDSKPTDTPAADGEVLESFAAEAGSLLDRIERLLSERTTAAPERYGYIARELHIAFATLRDAAETFGFARAEELAGHGIERVSRGRLEKLVDLVPAIRAAIGPSAGQDEAEGAGGKAGAEPSRAGAARPGKTGRTPARGSRKQLPEVPIEELLYRGPAALERALELEAQLRDLVASREAAPILDEIFDLIRLALPAEEPGAGR